MSEFKDEIRQRLEGLSLAPAREAEIVEELSQHLEDQFEQSVQGGATEQEGIDDAEDGAIGADPQREREHRDKGETWIL